MGTGAECHLVNVLKRKPSPTKIGKATPPEDDDPIKKVRTEEENEGVRVVEAEGGRAAHGSRPLDENMGRRVAKESATADQPPHQPSKEKSPLHKPSKGQPMSHGKPEHTFAKRSGVFQASEASPLPPPLVSMATTSEEKLEG